MRVFRKTPAGIAEMLKREYFNHEVGWHHGGLYGVDAETLYQKLTLEPPTSEESLQALCKEHGLTHYDLFCAECELGAKAVVRLGGHSYCEECLRSAILLLENEE